MSNHKGRYAAPRKPRTRNPFYLLAALAAVGLLLLAGACADTEAEAPADVVHNAERRVAGDAAPELQSDPVVDEAMSDREIFVLAMEMTFNSASATEMADMCLAVDVLGMDDAVDMYAEGFGSGWDPSYGSLVSAELRARC